jgi:hypothetical protein
MSASELGSSGGVCAAAEAAKTMTQSDANGTRRDSRPSERESAQRDRKFHIDVLLCGPHGERNATARDTSAARKICAAVPDVPVLVEHHSNSPHAA